VQVRCIIDYQFMPTVEIPAVNMSVVIAPELPGAASPDDAAVCIHFYVAAKATYIRLLYGQKGGFSALAP